MHKLLYLYHHPHIAQKADILTNAEGKKTYVFYSLGSLVTARVAHASESVDETGVNMAQTSAIVQFDLVKDEEEKCDVENRESPELYFERQDDLACRRDNGDCHAP